MEFRPYLRIRFPRAPRPTGVTLSVPGGIERALVNNRLPEGAEAFIPETETWAPLPEHPVVAAILSARSARPASESGWRKSLQEVHRWAAAL